MAIICDLLSFYTLVIFGRAIFSWFPNVSGVAAQIARFLFVITEPVLAPLRRALPSAGPIDFSPLILIIVVQVVQGLFLHC